MGVLPICMFVYASHACNTQEGQKRVPDPHGARVRRMILSYYVGQAIEASSSERATTALYQCAHCPAPSLDFS